MSDKKYDTDKLIDKTPKSFASRRFSRFDFWSELAIRLALTLAITAVAVTFAISVVNDVLALYKPPATADIYVNDSSKIAEELSKNGIIDHPWLFSLYVKLKGEGREIRSETVRVDSGMDYRRLLSAFTESQRQGVVRLTFPSGATTDEIINIFVENGIGSREGFVETINSYPFEYDFLYGLDERMGKGRKYRLDGYLYPDTYDFYTGREEPYYIYKLLDRFESVTNTVRAEIKKAEAVLDLDDVVVIASMIQRSSSHVGQYEILSSVLHNRLRSPDIYPFLECPSTSIYGLEGRGGVYLGTADDVVKGADTPYNTFMNEGLPPGAVCNPDINAMICAYRPAASSYKYFVTLRSGEALFASNQTEHEKNCRAVG